MHTHLLLPFIAYFCILLTIGLISHRRQNTAADFMVGNRSLNFWVTALSAHASDMSSWLFMGVPAAIYLSGLSNIWIGVGTLIGMFLNWQLVAKKLRTATERYDTYTVSSFLEKRFNDNTGILRLLTAVVSIFFLTSYVAAGLIGMGLLLESVFEIDFYIGLSLATSVILIYTFAGGFITVAWTDLFQALFLIAAILVVPIIAFTHLENGWSDIINVAATRNISLNILPDPSIESITAVLFLILAWAPGYFGQLHIITKFMGINDPANLKKSKYVGMTWQVLALTAAILVGLVGMAFFKDVLANPQLVFVEMVKVLFHPLAAGFILCGVLAASISTMDSQILVSASVFSEDLYVNLFRRNASQKEILIISRVGVVLVTLFSLFLAFNKNSTILEAVLYAWAGLGCAFGPVILAALYSKRTNNYGAIAGVLVGGLIAGLWPTINPYIIDLSIPSMIPGFTLSALSIYLISCLTKVKNPKESTSEG